MTCYCQRVTWRLWELYTLAAGVKSVIRRDRCPREAIAWAERNGYQVKVIK